MQVQPRATRLLAHPSASLSSTLASHPCAGHLDRDFCTKNFTVTCLYGTRVPSAFSPLCQVTSCGAFLASLRSSRILPKDILRDFDIYRRPSQPTAKRLPLRGEFANTWPSPVGRYAPACPSPVGRRAPESRPWILISPVLSRCLPSPNGVGAGSPLLVSERESHFHSHKVLSNVQCQRDDSQTAHYKC